MDLAPQVVAVIPTFHPTDHVRGLVESLVGQVAHIVISDDASPCTSDLLLREFSNSPGVTVLRHQRNAGVARGLNEGLAIAREQHAPWLLTIDQDSQVSRTYVQDLLNAAAQRLEFGEPLAAIGAAAIHDTSGPMTYPLRGEVSRPITEELIQTGTLWRTDLLTESGGFDEELAMDAVDAAACLALRQRGFTIGVAPGTSLEHSIGSARVIHVLGRSIMITGHSPQRRTSMLRNRLRLFPAEFRQSPRHAIRTVRRVAINQTFGIATERQRWSKARGSLRGLNPHSGR